jgi:DNA-directed RNA polymerase beta subunit
MTEKGTFIINGTERVIETSQALMFDFIDCRELPRIEVSEKMLLTRSIRIYNEELGAFWSSLNKKKKC